jgi:hypothetical protein
MVEKSLPKCQQILQRHFLRFHRSLFAENFYGLERKFLVEKSFARTLVFGVLLPYLKLKLDRLFEKLRDDQVSQC